MIGVKAISDFRYCVKIICFPGFPPADFGYHISLLVFIGDDMTVERLTPPQTKNGEQ